MPFPFKFRTEDSATCWCPACGTRLPPDDINGATDWASCRRCGTATRVSELMNGGAFPRVDLSRPVKGVTLQREGSHSVIAATTRSAMAFFLIPFLCVWSGASLSVSYGPQLQRGVFDLRSSLFGLPFLVGTLVLGPRCLMSVFGRVTVIRNGDDGSVFTGVGILGWRRQFRWSELESVREVIGRETRKGRPPKLIILNFRPGTRSPLRFGTMLSEERRWFIMAAIQAELKHR
jgi:hypothetical protein